MGFSVETKTIKSKFSTNIIGCDLIKISYQDFLLGISNKDPIKNSFLEAANDKINENVGSCLNLLENDYFVTEKCEINGQKINYEVRRTIYDSYSYQYLAYCLIE